MGKSGAEPDHPTGKSPRCAPGVRVYAIGDIHGCYAELCELLEKIEKDNAARPAADCVLVFLGDLVDRGPHSREVIRHLRDRPPEFARRIFLRGNHEEIVVRALSGEPSTIPDWLRYGGEAFVRSYDIDPAELNLRNLRQLERAILPKVPREDIAFLSSFIDGVRFGDYLFVHAGVRPGVPLAAQSGTDLRWIRDEFLESPDDFGLMIVHGHTINPEVVERPNRIGLDTGAYVYGVLTAMRFEAEERSTLSAGVRRAGLRPA